MKQIQPSDPTSNVQMRALPVEIEQQDLVVFELGEQVYAIPIAHILQIVEMVTITPIPQVNPIVQGAVNLRGEAVPIINMRRYLSMPDMPLDLHTPIIFIQLQRLDDSAQKIGLIVDEVIDVMRALDDHVTPLPDILPEALHRAPIVQGLVQTQYGMVILLDLPQLFTAAQKAALLSSSAPEPAALTEAAS